MEIKRKIAKVVNKVSYKEAEEADDKFWANATPEERLNELVSLRKMVFGTRVTRIKKVVAQRSLYDEED